MRQVCLCVEGAQNYFLPSLQRPSSGHVKACGMGKEACEPELSTGKAANRRGKNDFNMSPGDKEEVATVLPPWKPELD